MPVTASPHFLRIGTRGSPLALVQARYVRQLLAAHHKIDENRIEIKIIKTDGDRTQSENLSLKDIGGKGLFSKQIEEQLLADAIDLGVHSAKDMATILPDGLVMNTYLKREDVRDGFISPVAKTLQDLPMGATIGTSSLRRAAQLLHFRPDLKIIEFRGNVETRLQKLADGVADATLVAMAGLNRLNKSKSAASMLDPKIFPPAPAQGAIGLETRSDDARTNSLVAPLNHLETFQAVSAERAMLAILDGSCRTPIGVFTVREGTNLSLTGQLLSPDGKQCFCESVQGNTNTARLLGEELGKALVKSAGSEFLNTLKAL